MPWRCAQPLAHHALELALELASDKAMAHLNMSFYWD